MICSKCGENQKGPFTCESHCGMLWLCDKCFFAKEHHENWLRWWEDTRDERTGQMPGLWINRNKWRRCEGMSKLRTANPIKGYCNKYGIMHVWEKGKCRLCGEKNPVPVHTCACHKGLPLGRKERWRFCWSTHLLPCTILTPILRQSLSCLD